VPASSVGRLPARRYRRTSASKSRASRRVLNVRARFLPCCRRPTRHTTSPPARAAFSTLIGIAVHPNPFRSGPTGIAALKPTAAGCCAEPKTAASQANRGRPDFLSQSQPAQQASRGPRRLGPVPANRSKGGKPRRLTRSLTSCWWGESWPLAGRKKRPPTGTFVAAKWEEPDDH
jgi:hypothetical protein